MAHLIEMWNEYADRLVDNEVWRQEILDFTFCSWYVDLLYSPDGSRWS